jgi:hypothetical protein
VDLHEVSTFLFLELRKVLAMVYHTQGRWLCGLYPSSGILNNCFFSYLELQTMDIVPKTSDSEFLLVFEIRTVQRAVYGIPSACLKGKGEGPSWGFHKLTSVHRF